jgi:hypothetical protein
MRIRNQLSLAGLTAAMLLTSPTPAFAGSYGGISVGGGSHGLGYGIGYGRSWGGGRYHRRHRDRVHTGDVIGAIAIIGVIAAVASAASKAKGQQRSRDDNRYPDQARRDEDRRDNGSIRSEDQAVDACAVEAEQRAGRTASVRDITDVRRANDGWDVEGVIEERESYRDRTAEKRRFSCSVRFGRIDNLYIDGGTVALR